MNSNFWKRLNDYPPALCRLLARKSRGRPLTNEEIGNACGMTPFEVVTISNCLDWRGIDVYTVAKFTAACGMDFTSAVRMKRFESYRRSRPKYIYLKRDPDWESFYLPLTKLLLTRKKP